MYQVIKVFRFYVSEAAYKTLTGAVSLESGIIRVRKGRVIGNGLRLRFIIAVEKGARSFACGLIPGRNRTVTNV